MRGRFTDNSVAAFTLIELAVVVVIVGIIIAIAVPRFGQMSDRSAASAANQSFAMLEKAILMYQGENQAFPPDPPAPEKYLDELDGYIGRQAWELPVPIGGHWDWIGPSRPAYMGIAVHAPVAGGYAGWSVLDRMFDDNDAAGGAYQVYSNWLCRPLANGPKPADAEDVVGLGAAVQAVQDK